MEYYHARAWFRRQLSGAVLDWLHRHPRRETACRFYDEQYYIAQTFEYAWHGAASQGACEFGAMATVVRYVRASLNAAMLDALRAFKRAQEIPAHETGSNGKLLDSDGHEQWKMVQGALSNDRERRLAYLFFHCGLKPGEIVDFCPHEFHDVHEIMHIRREIIKSICSLGHA